MADSVSDLIEIPFDAEKFATACGLRRGRAIQVATCREMFDPAQTEDVDGVCLVTGLAMTYHSGDVTILVHADITDAHREHVILHELAHALFEHHPSNPNELTDRQVRSLFGELFTPDAVRSILASGRHERAGLSTTEEREAEAFADEILTRTQHHGDLERASIAWKYGLSRP